MARRRDRPSELPPPLAYWLNVETELLGADETAAQSITLDLIGRTVLSVIAWADAATTFTLMVSHDNTNWRTHKTYTTVTEVCEGFIVGARYWRLSSAAAGVAGNKVNLVLQGGR